jgi:hypothetical protein
MNGGSRKKSAGDATLGSSGNNRSPAATTPEMGSLWEHMPPDMAVEILKKLKRNNVFHEVCKGWRDAHEQSVTCLRVTVGKPLPSSFY